jgi:hypothetical protein
MGDICYETKITDSGVAELGWGIWLRVARNACVCFAVLRQRQEDIGGLQIPMHNILGVEILDTRNNIKEQLQRWHQMKTMTSRWYALSVIVLGCSLRV